MVPEAAVAGTITHFRERCDDSTDQPCARDRGSSVVQHRYAAIARCAARPGGGDRDVPDAVSRLRQSRPAARSEEHTSELQSLMRISYAVFCLKKKNKEQNSTT